MVIAADAKSTSRIHTYAHCISALLLIAVSYLYWSSYRSLILRHAATVGLLAYCQRMTAQNQSDTMTPNANFKFSKLTREFGPISKFRYVRSYGDFFPLASSFVVLRVDRGGKAYEEQLYILDNRCADIISALISSTPLSQAH